jgi:hypothetical protein
MEWVCVILVALGIVLIGALLLAGMAIGALAVVVLRRRSERRATRHARG